ncbi:HMG_box domain-containing protein/ARID domain-containing protein [Cephalotus follicularis]|uniref:HMG_box domain-containing protein/ARID domain-containing protein n=1 Tax=Cephalotus follicularis TaxID=3775 RepID=A0A1Q3BIU6_CEPFO|nr:HMG_box domain-containing protein/ARID domain-containing protein [Cephalotus follicularis]
MASTSCAKQSPLPMKEPASNYNPYPPALARYEDVVACPKLFKASLEKLHAIMGTKFMIPIIGGKELDLHRLFVEVTSRGGIEKVIRERRWKEVTAIFNFPSTATNASFVLRKYYGSLLHHYEQIYFFKAQGWTPISTESLQNSPITPSSAKGAVQRSPEIQATVIPQPRINTADFPVVARSASSSSGSPVIGVIDGKFESGYLVTVTIGSEKLKGVLYLAPQNAAQQLPQQYSFLATNSENAHAASGVQRRRRRRKKNEIKRRDPAHPKPNRSGYNFFFAEQHARLKPLHPGKDRDISKIIGDLWTKLIDSEKAVYQEKALKDKERYRTEMEDYRERLRTGQVISDAVPLQQRFPDADMDMVEADTKSTEETEGGDSLQTPDNEITSGETDTQYDKTAENDITMDLDLEASPGVGANAQRSNVAVETQAEDMTKREENVGDER